MSEVDNDTVFQQYSDNKSEIFPFIIYNKTLILPDNEKHDVDIRLFECDSKIIDSYNNQKIIILPELDFFFNKETQELDLKKPDIGVLSEINRKSDTTVEINPLCVMNINSMDDDEDEVEAVRISDETTETLERENQAYQKCISELQHCIHIQYNIMNYVNETKCDVKLCHEYEVDFNKSLQTSEEAIVVSYKLINMFNLGEETTEDILKQPFIYTRLEKTAEALKIVKKQLAQHFTKLTNTQVKIEEASELDKSYLDKVNELDLSSRYEVNRFVSEIDIPVVYKNKIRKMINDSSYSYREKEYIHNVLKLPFYTDNMQTRTAEEIMEILNSIQYGMDGVKDKISDYVLLYEKNPKQTKLPVLCLNGKPGTGKTSLAYAIAKALNRPLVNCSLGGVDDASTIIGFDYTYRSATPGMITRNMQRSPVSNPVFLLDEIDKLMSSHGDPVAALLSVLDPVQNNSFEDRYIGLPYDLSNVMFVCTSNNKERIPAPLRDRLEIIDIPSYTDFEKITIAKKYLIPKLQERYDLQDANIQISEDDILYIIRSYTAEAGVRELERCLESIIRKIVILFSKDEQDIVVTREQMIQWLGKGKYCMQKKEAINDIGTIGACYGIAKNQNGEEVAEKIETLSYAGSNAITTTGFMNQGAMDAIVKVCSIIKANLSLLNCTEEQVKDKNYHVDNENYGTFITQDNAAQIFVSVLSSIMQKPVPNTICVIGRLSLNGAVMSVNNFEEKINVANRAGFVKVIVSEENMSQSEISEDILQCLQIIPVRTIGELVNAVFGNVSENRNVPRS